MNYSFRQSINPSVNQFKRLVGGILSGSNNVGSMGKIGGKGGGKSGKSKSFSVAELVAKAEELVDQCQPELAVKFFERALVKEPTNTALLDMVGELSTELHEPERALAAFQRSMELAPAANPAKWFYAAQLVAGEEAEKYSLQGIQYLRQELQQLDPQVCLCACESC